MNTQKDTLLKKIIRTLVVLLIIGSLLYFVLPYLITSLVAPPIYLIPLAIIFILIVIGTVKVVRFLIK